LFQFKPGSAYVHQGGLWGGLYQNFQIAFCGGATPVRSSPASSFASGASRFERLARTAQFIKRWVSVCCACMDNAKFPSPNSATNTVCGRYKNEASDKPGARHVFATRHQRQRLVPGVTVDLPPPLHPAIPMTKGLLLALFMGQSRWSCIKWREW
jgi:hypothetical protein